MFTLLVTSPARPVLRVAVGALAVTAPDMAMALTCLVTWAAPGLLGADVVGYVVTTLLLEFFVIHSAAFMGVAAVAPFPRALRVAIVVALGGLYMLMLQPIARVTGQPWIVWAFWGLVLNRLWALAAPAVDAGLRSSQPVQSEWLRCGLLYVGLAVITSLLPVPTLGFAVDGAWQRAAGTGLWVDAPQHAMAFGALYFGGNAWLRLRASAA